MKKSKVLVCGLGQGGHAISAHLSNIGHDVSLYSHTPAKVDKIKNQNNKINVTGLFDGSFKISDITGNLEEAIKDKDFLFIVSDANSHRYYAEKIANYLINQRVILVSPGIGGAMSFYNIINKKNPDNNIYVSETDTLMYACKVKDVGLVDIKNEKNEMIYTTFPDKDKVSSEFLESAYPQFSYIKNSLMGLDDSPVFHIVGMIKNADRILNREDFNFYIDGINEETGALMENMDKERCRVAEAVGLKPRNINDWLHNVYGVKKESLHEMIKNTPPYQDKNGTNRSPAPKTLYHRYLMEEIPLRAVPTVSIAKIFGIEIPIYEKMIDEASSLIGVDFWRVGRTIEDMGLNQEYFSNLNERK